jgi:hypothetical protein
MELCTANWARDCLPTRARKVPYEVHQMTCAYLHYPDLHCMVTGECQVQRYTCRATGVNTACAKSYDIARNCTAALHASWVVLGRRDAMRQPGLVEVTALRLSRNTLSR